MASEKTERMGALIGRESEKRILSDILNSNQAELLAIYGRRRVGKTYLIRTFFEKNITFELTGLLEESLSRQLDNFAHQVSVMLNKGKPVRQPKNWLEAFRILTQYLESQRGTRKQVIFLDEFPWLETPRSGFLAAFDHFWNNWAVKQSRLAVVICGSAASWMIQKVVNHRGGLHNRLTRRIRLLPFNLAETENFLKSRKVVLNRYQILQLYMVIGGIPHYLKEIKPGESSIQIIDRLCFSKDGLLTTEFHNLYAALFRHSERHEALVRMLAGRSMGLTRAEIVAGSNLQSGGSTSRLLEELIESGFITAQVPFGKTLKDSIYKLTDEFSLFYLKFMDKSRANGEGTWIKKSQSSSWKSWSGLAFEQICQKHFPQIKKSLGINGIHSEISAWRSNSKAEDGAQIDLVIDRNDQCINLCEIKFSIAPFEITKAYAVQLEQKRVLFHRKTKTRKTLFITLITTFGLQQNAHSTNLVQSEISMESLFSE